MHFRWTSMKLLLLGLYFAKPRPSQKKQGKGLGSPIKPSLSLSLYSGNSAFYSASTAAKITNPKLSQSKADNICDISHHNPGLS